MSSFDSVTKLVKTMQHLLFLHDILYDPLRDSYPNKYSRDRNFTSILIALTYS